jgi:hypothetical protein
MLLDRWCPETHSFYFPWGEMVVTLEDVKVPDPPRAKDHQRHRGRDASDQLGHCGFGRDVQGPVHGCTKTGTQSILLRCPLLLHLWSYEQLPVGRPSVDRSSYCRALSSSGFLLLFSRSVMAVVLAVVYTIVESSLTCFSCPQHRDNHQSSPTASLPTTAITARATAVVALFRGSPPRHHGEHPLL